MSEFADTTTAGTVDVVLVGGPSGLPPTIRAQRVHLDGSKIKIDHCGGYEHFERETEPSDAANAPIVFRWTARTRVAE